MPGYSLHIGLNHCDPDAYPDWDSTLGGCINDANSMMQLASAAGFRTKRLIDAEASSNAVLAAIGALGRTCRPGDIALISYSGHGGQVPDTNGDETEDQQDETWVLYDRQVSDDELNQMYSQFAAGVRILVVSDSCHSGTVARSVVNLATRHALATNPVGKDLWPTGVVVEETRPRAMAVSFARKDAERQRGLYQLVQTLTRGSKNPDLAASLILLSGCQDNQLSYDGTVNGAFTTALLQVWNQGRYTGDYRAFLSAIVNRMPADQTPNLFTLGEASAFAAQKPFSVDGAAGGSGSGGSSTAGTRPTLREGSRGPDVVYLQQRLTVHGYTLAADGTFGRGTGQAVRAFQLSRGLTADGVVGPVTWQALDRSPSDAGSGGSWNPDGEGADGPADEWGSDSGSGESGSEWGSDSGSDSGESGSEWGSDSGSGSGTGESGSEWGSDSGSEDSGSEWGSDSDPGSGTGESGSEWGSDSGSEESGSEWGSDSGTGESGSDWGSDSDSGSDSGSGEPGSDWGSDSDSGESGSDWGAEPAPGERDAASGASADGHRSPQPRALTLSRPDVGRGDTGEHVRYVQKCLRSAGYRGPADGTFSERLESAVRAFQRSQGLPVTGFVDQRTWAALPLWIES